MSETHDIFTGAYAGYSVTGIRQYDISNNWVLITGSYPDSKTKTQQGFVYIGPAEQINTSGINYPTPSSSITQSIFYGPNTALFNPDIGKTNTQDNICLVGSCQKDGGFN